MHSAIVDIYLSFWLYRVSDPSLAASQLFLFWEKQSANVLTLHNLLQYVIHSSISNNHRFTCIYYHGCRLQLGLHAAHPPCSLRIKCQLLNFIRNIFYNGNNGCLAFCRWKSIIQPVNGREDNEQLCIQQVRHQRGKRIVITELDFIHGNRVILVYDRNGIHLKQRMDRIAGIQIPLAVFKVLTGKEYLCRMVTVKLETLVVCPNQFALAYRSNCL